MRVIVISDLHFGVPESSINDPEVRLMLIKAIKSLFPIERIILLGDIFDLNLARLGDAIDGRSIHGKKIIGFRQFLKECYDQGIGDLRWIYIPGNHDYDTFDVPARLYGMARRFSKKTEEKIMYWPPRCWEGGNIAPKEWRKNFEIQYPHRWEKIGPKYILLTHGHYFDPSQTMGKKIVDINKSGGIPLDKFFTLCAQYQSLTRAISYQGQTINFFGTLYKCCGSAQSFIQEIMKYGTMGLFRNRALDAHLQNASLAYIKHFGPLGQSSGAPVLPDAMVSGHTHKEGMVFVDEKKTAPYGFKKGFLLVNDGGFIHSPSDGNILGSLVEMESTAGDCKVILHVIERSTYRNIETRVKEERTI